MTITITNSCEGPLFNVKGLQLWHLFLIICLNDESLEVCQVIFGRLTNIDVSPKP